MPRRHLRAAELGLADYGGVASPKVKVGVVDGLPVLGLGGFYDGRFDLDWWYTPNPGLIDMAGLPSVTVPADLVKRVFTAGPGSLTFPLTLQIGVPPSPLRMSAVRLEVSLGADSAPWRAFGFAPPGHLASENLDPNLVSFESAGQPNGNGAGRLCGSVTAASLAQVPLPMLLLAQCPGYTPQNSLLDLLVGGCELFGFLQVLAPAQPDTEDPDAPAVGAGAPYTLSAGPNLVISGCKDRIGTQQKLADCLADASYTSYFKFTSDRVLLRR